MKALLMYKDRDFDLEQSLPWNSDALVQDLGLSSLFDRMGRGDELVTAVAKSALLCGLTSSDAILYRQASLRDCIANEAEIRLLFDLVTKAVAKERSNFWGWFTPTSPAGILNKGTERLGLFIPALRDLRSFAERNAEQFNSDGFSRLLATWRKLFSEDYLTKLSGHVKVLGFRNGAMLAAGLGPDNRSGDYVVQADAIRRRCWLARLFYADPPRTFRLDPRDESGARALGELKDRALGDVTSVLGTSTEHILGFFLSLRRELAFFVGCLNLREWLLKNGYPLSLPVTGATPEVRYSGRGLYDAGLALRSAKRLIGNELRAGDRRLIIITGANQGGKSTFLRAIGIAQLMLQAGMFVPARSFSSPIAAGLFTHFRREEDEQMQSGKFDEELSRFNAMVSHLAPSTMVLFNESFAATNERDGSEIATHILRALLENRVRVVFVTHLYSLAESLFKNRFCNGLFLRAERGIDGERTFRLREAEPLETSNAADIYARIFGDTDLLHAYASQTEPSRFEPQEKSI